MNKAAPSFARIAAMVVFALSCFGLLLYLWLAFGGPIPLKPQGYRFTTSFAEATQLATEADVRISGVPVGKVKKIEPDSATGRSLVVIELEGDYAPLPSDARAILRQKTLLGETYVELTPGSPDADPIAEGGTLAAAQVSPTVQLDEIYRTFDSRHARGLPVLDAAAGAGDRRERPRRQRGARQPRPVRRGHGGDRRHPQPRGGRAARPGLEHRRRVRGADRAPGPAAVADRELQPRVLDHRRARPRAAGGVPGAADVRARVARDAQPAGAVRARHRPAGRRSCGRRRASSARRCRTSASWPRTSKACCATSGR